MFGPLKIVLSQKFIADRCLNKRLKTINKVLENNGKIKVLNFKFWVFVNFGFVTQTRICASLGSHMKFKTLCYPVFGINKNTALPSFLILIILIAFNASIVCPINK